MFSGYQNVNVYANYTNQNYHNNLYNNYYYSYNNRNDYDGDEYKQDDNNYHGTHDPNNVYAENDGSQYNNAGSPEDPEMRISYFLEDVGINAFHAGIHVQNPPFFGSNSDFNFYTSNDTNRNSRSNNNINIEDAKKGEAFYYAHQQFYARYVLERISNDLPIPEPINFYDKIKVIINLKY